MRYIAKYFMVFSFILSGCAAFLRTETKSKDIFMQYALKRIPNSVESKWMIEHTFKPYTAELFRLYLKSKGIKVPDTIWFDFSHAVKWVNNHKDLFRDTTKIKEMILIFREIGNSSGLIISRRVERARFEWEMQIGDRTIYWYDFPRKIMAVFPEKVVYYRGPFCREGKNKDRILIAFPSINSGYIKPLNSTYYWDQPEGVDSILIFFYEGKWDKDKMEYLIHHPVMGSISEPILSQFINDYCIRFANNMYFLKDGTWYRVRIYSKVYFEEHIVNWDESKDAIFGSFTEDSSVYVWGKLKIKDRVYYTRHFSDSVFRDVLKFVEKHRRDIVRSGR